MTLTIILFGKQSTNIHVQYIRLQVFIGAMQATVISDVCIFSSIKS